ncbi:hypothetical protein AAMO2058_000704800 [Amorphochlora amoebiformis]
MLQNQKPTPAPLKSRLRTSIQILGFFQDAGNKSNRSSTPPLDSLLSSQLGQFTAQMRYNYISVIIPRYLFSIPRPPQSE